MIVIFTNYDNHASTHDFSSINKEEIAIRGWLLKVFEGQVGTGQFDVVRQLDLLGQQFGH